MFTPIQNKRLYMLAVEQIKDLIEQEKLKPGDKLPPERELANILNLSRSTTREAIAALEVMGYIEVKVGLGTFIKGVEGININNDVLNEFNLNASPTELFETRVLIEPIISRLAAQRATDKDIYEARRILIEDYDPSLETAKQAEKRDQNFHLEIARIANNEVLYKFQELINNERSNKLWDNLRFHNLQIEGRIEQYQMEHYKILNAIEAKDSILAETLTRNHLEVIMEEFLDSSNNI